MTEPYYEDEYVTLYHGDCLELAELWTGADVLVTDPPYGIAWSAPSGWTNAAGKGGHRSTGQPTRIANDDNLAYRDAALALWGDRPALVFGALTRPFPDNTGQVLIYHKSVDAGIRGARAGFRHDVEAIFMLGKWPVGIGGRSSVLTSLQLVAGPAGVGFTAGHPHAKPLDVLRDLIERCPPGVVADPFAGSGSTLVAAKQLGRKAIGIELEERYCEIAARRLSQGVLNFGDTND